MDTPALDLYAVEAMNEKPGQGFRIYRSDDAVYEAWAAEDSDAEGRLYLDEDGWRVKVRFPDTDMEAAYNRFITTAEEVNDAYGTALDISPKRFRERANKDGTVTVADGGTTLHYREETELDEIVEDMIGGEIADSSLAKGLLTGGAACVGIGAAVGAGIGAAIGSLAGPPGVVGGAALGAQVGGIHAGGGFFMGDGIPTVMASRRDPNYFWRYGSGLPVQRATTRFEERRQRKRYSTVDAVREHLSSVNRLHSLAEEVAVIREMDREQVAELEELERSDIEEVHSGLMDIHFHRVEDGRGVTAVHEADTYAEACRFAAAATGESFSTGQRPSLYTAPDAFKTVFNQCTYRERGETKYFADARILAGNAYHHDGSLTIVGWLEEEHPGLLQDVRQG